MTLPFRFRPRVVLVHGAFGNAASWSGFVPMLEDRGLSVIPAQCPQASFSTDVAAVWSIIDEQDGDVLLVAHSWDGAVISEACRHPRVRGAVYIASGSDTQQALGEWLTEFPALGTVLGSDDPSAAGVTWTWKSKPTWFIYGEQGQGADPVGAPMPAQLADIADIIAQAAAELAGQGPAQAPLALTPGILVGRCPRGRPPAHHSHGLILSVTGY